MGGPGTPMGIRKAVWDMDDDPDGNVRHIAEHGVSDHRIRGGTMKRATRSRHLTPEEAAKYKAIRGAVEAEKPEISARIRSQMAAKRKAAAHASGDQTLGQRIHAAREAIGESQVNVAASAGISQGYLSQLEQDEREPTLSIAVRLARALGVSLDELASGIAPSS